MVYLSVLLFLVFLLTIYIFSETNPIVSYVRSEKGNLKLREQGYEYHLDITNGEKSYWRCVSYKKLKCHARVHSKNNTIIARFKEHNHGPKTLLHEEIFDANIT